MLVVAQVPPQRLMALAIPLYSLGVLLLLATLAFGITKRARRAGSTWAWSSNPPSCSSSPRR